MNNEALNKELKNANTLNEVIKVMNKYYDLDEKLGLLNKGVILTGLQKVIKITNIKPR